MDVSKKVAEEGANFLFEMKERYKLSSIKILTICSLIRRSVFISNIAHLASNTSVACNC